MWCTVRTKKYTKIIKIMIDAYINVGIFLHLHNQTDPNKVFEVHKSFFFFCKMNMQLLVIKCMDAVLF